MVHLCAPTTYAKQDKQLCDSKIYNFKHDGYHKVKSISKRLGYRNTARETRGCVTAVPSLLREVRLRWRGVSATKGPLKRL